MTTYQHGFNRQAKRREEAPLCNIYREASVAPLLVGFSGVYSSEGAPALSPEARLGVAIRPKHQAPKVRRHSGT